MPICLSHASADRALEAIAHMNLKLEPTSSNLLDEFSASYEAIAEVRDTLQQLLGEDARRPELVVGRQRGVHNSNYYVAHQWTAPLPEGAIARVGNGLYVSLSPFCLLQQATTLHMVHLCQMLGRHMANASPPDLKRRTRPLPRASLVSEESLSTFLAQTTQVKGKTALYEAMRWTAPGAVSPEETNLQLALTLPYAYGGFGIPKPLMNYELEFTERSKRIRGEGHETCYVDLYWPRGHCGLEYQSQEHGDQLGDDYARFYALDALGEFVWPVAWEQTRSAAQMSYIAEKIAAKVGKRMSLHYWPSEMVVQRLLDTLAGAVIPQPGERLRQRRANSSNA